MKNFLLEPSGKIVFGSGCVREYLAGFARQYGPSTLLVSGVRSGRENGACDAVLRSLRDAGKHVVELSGVRPGPDYADVQAGARLAREQQVDLILGVGGGSVMDCCKAIAMAAVFRGDLWENFWAKPGVVDFQPLPVGIVPTTMGTGELNGAAVLVRQGAREVRSYPQCSPQFILFDPAYTRTLPRGQVLSDGFRIFGRALELYLAPPAAGAAVTDGLLEALMGNVVAVFRSGAYQTEEGRADLMWAGALVGNAVFQAGKRCSAPSSRAALILSHQTDRAFTDCLAALQLSAYRTACREQPGRMVRLAARVWGITGKPAAELAQAGADAFAEFLQSLGFSTEDAALPGHNGADAAEFPSDVNAAAASALSAGRRR